MDMTSVSELENIIESDSTAIMHGKYLTFLLDNQLFGVPISDVVQIVGMQAITQIPEFPSYAKGIINLRGSMIPLIDVRLRLCKEERPYDERTCIVVTLIHGISVGFIVDEVDSVTDIDDDSICEPPKFSNETMDSYLTGVAEVDKTVVLLLNMSELLPENVMTNIIYRGNVKC